MRSTRRWWVAFVAIPLATVTTSYASTRWALLNGDGLQQALPLHLLVARMWRASEIPAWNPYTFSGSPLLANGIAGVFYPPNLLFLVLSPVFANNVTVLLSFCVAGSGCYVFARHLTGDRVAALVSAVTFAGSGFFFGHVVHQAVLASACWLPWALYGVERCRIEWSFCHVLIGSIAVALAGLAGQAQTFATIVLAVAVYGLVLVTRRSVRPAVAALVVVVIGTGLAAIQLVPTLSVLHDEDFRLSYGLARSYSFPLSHLPLLLFPYLFGSTSNVFPYQAAYRGLWNLDELNGYVGAAALVFAAIATRLMREDRRLVALVVLATLGLALASAGAWPLGHLVYLLPLYGNFRDWGRYVLFTDLAVALLAGCGVAELRGAPLARRRSGLRVAALVPVGLGLAAVGVRLIGPMRRFEVGGTSGWAALLVPVLAAAAGLGAAWSLVRSLRLAAVIAVAVVLLDGIGAFGGWKVGVTPTGEVTSVLSARATPSWGTAATSPGGLSRFLFVGNRTVYSTDSYPDVSDMQRLHSANGYVPLGLLPRAYASALGGMDYEGNVPDPAVLWSPNGHLLDLLRITAIMFDPGYTNPTPDGQSDLSFAGTVAGGLLRYDHQPTLADAFVVGQIDTKSHVAVLAAINGDVPWNPSAEALVESTCKECPSGHPGSAGHVIDERWTDLQFHALVRATRPGMLVISQAWFPGWAATVNRHSVPVVRVDGLLQGVPVATGTERVTLTYRAPGLRLGELITVMMATALLGTAIGLRRCCTTRSAIL
jgi:hypothetical protein